jgi:ribosomal protein S18 acetylase RimI-like enzyme
MEIEIRILQPGDEAVLERVAEDVFDFPVQAELTAEFLRDARHHLAVAIDAGLVVGMASALTYVHPDKPTQLWINEVGVAPTHQRRGIGRRLMQALFEAGRARGCREAWVGTEHTNAAALALYGSLPEKRAREDFVLFEFEL